MALASVTDVDTVHTPGAPLPEGHFAAFPPVEIMPDRRRVRTGLHLRRSTYAPGVSDGRDQEEPAERQQRRAVRAARVVRAQGGRISDAKRGLLRRVERLQEGAQT